MTLDSKEVSCPVDLVRLAAWMDDQDLGAGPIQDVRQLGGGTQNVLLVFTRSERSYVLRRPPINKRPNSDETMRREARILSALGNTTVPHPPLIAACPEPGVIGAAFYLMEPVDGFGPTQDLPLLYRSDRSTQHQLGIAMLDGLLELSKVDPKRVGLSDIGRPNGWLQRQVPRWRTQLEGYRTAGGYDSSALSGLDRISEWMEANIPSESKNGLIHGDYTLGNVMVERDRPALAAIVDWELSTQGDPLLDLSHMLVTWPGSENAAQVVGEDMPGLPSRDELVERYARESSRGLDDLVWFEVLACYRLSIILEGTYVRAEAGQAPKELGEELHGLALALLSQAEELVG